MHRFEYLSTYCEADVMARWDDSLVVLDTCVLLNAYSSRQSAEAMASFLEKLAEEGRLRMPYQVEFEFFKHRMGKIKEENGKHVDINTMQSLVAKLEDAKSLDGLGADQKKDVKDSFVKMSAIVKGMQKKQYVQTYSDPLEMAIKALPEESCLVGIPDGGIEGIEGKYDNRIARCCPPGLKDFQDKELDASFLGRNPRYGDCLIWEEILELGRAERRDVVFVTDDIKDGDWTWPGKSVGESHLAHPLLRKEYSEESDGREFFLIDGEALKRLAKRRYDIIIGEGGGKSDKEASSGGRLKRTAASRLRRSYRLDDAARLVEEDEVASLESMYIRRLELTKELQELNRRIRDLHRLADDCTDDIMESLYRDKAAYYSRKRTKVNQELSLLDNRARRIVVGE